MKKKFYLIPGWEDSPQDTQYKNLSLMIERKGYELIHKNINWKQKLSEQFFEVESDSVIFGFSLGAVLARLIAQEHVCEHLILASMTPLASFSEDKETRKALAEITGIDFVDDIEHHLRKGHSAKKQTILYGDREDELADVLVMDTGHEINDAYVKEVERLI